MIQINNLSYRYAGAKAEVFSNFSLGLGDSKIYGLLGKNGTGKSTLLYLISGLLRRQGGSIVVNGKDISRRNPDLLADIFIVPEEYDLPRMSLDNYIRYNAGFYPRFSRDTLYKCLDDFEMPTDIKLNALSMGQKKKVYMSFALAANTRLLLMDEPTNGLDIPSKSQFRKVVAGNMGDDCTVVVSTHQVHDVETLLDHIIMLDHAEARLNMPVEDICRKYVFGDGMQGGIQQDILYSEPSVRGCRYIARRQEDMPEIGLNLELLFDAVVSGKI